MDLTKALASLTPESRFPTFRQILARIDELAGAFPGVIAVDTIGFTADGNPLRRLRLGTGARQAVVIGMPHPNEPTGSLGALQLVELLCRNPRMRGQLGFTWHVLPCADPDGTALNESWFYGPFTRETYSAGIYRPPIDVDFEWTFHRADLNEPGLAPTPGSRAVMALIDEVRPELLVSMHNNEAGGLYAYATHDDVPIAAGFEQTSRLTGLPVDCGFAEAPADTLAPGIFLAEPLLDGGAMISSTDYAGKYGTFGVIVEPPLWIAPQVTDTRLTHITAGRLYDEMELERTELREEYAGWLSTLDHEVDRHSTRWAAIAAGTKNLEHPWHPMTDEDHRMTFAEVSSVKRLRDLERLRLAGHVVAAVAHSPHRISKAESHVLGQARAALRRWSLAAEGGEFCGLDRAVAAHVGITLTCADAIRARG
ncbi:hypothetical protein MUN74_18290 [Agromyces endophyticus]|uniref:M14 family zinc carboxypeptidase n=1 Tax=Agromyces sp. H17E-10 TaxID=2932244 RepID=UPI001FD2E861|nr:M14 family zinc carboxypeptidase [Agromyces sp. H17E-10]UOQ89183.1 hypothetical protein MUN74_18290 [Agromyces sp. H17E-10]